MGQLLIFNASMKNRGEYVIQYLVMWVAQHVLKGLLMVTFHTKCNLVLCVCMNVYVWARTVQILHNNHQQLFCRLVLENMWHDIMCNWKLTLEGPLW